MNLVSLTNSTIGVGSAFLLGRVTPQALGYRLADWAAGQFSRRPHLPTVQAARANQRVVRGTNVSEAELDEAVRQVFASAARCLYDYYHLSSNPQAVWKKLSFSPQTQAMVERVRDGQATIAVAGHISAFDLAMHALALAGLRSLVLTVSTLNEGYKVQNQVRRSQNLEIVPMGVAALREAKKRLLNGGSIMTGLDRPLPPKEVVKYQPRFFGKLANLPVAYIRLALDTGTPVVVLSCITLPDGRYRVEATDLIHMQPAADLHTSIISNAERVLAAAETFVRQNANQWSMFYPVWRSDE